MPVRETNKKFKFKNSFQVILVNFLGYATCRTARQFREIPEAAARLTHAEFPYYNIMAPDGKRLESFS